MEKKIEIIVEFFKEIFGDDFKLNGLSTEEGEIKYITESTDEEIKNFFMLSLGVYIWYNPFDGILYSYKPKEDSFFKIVFTNAWAFTYVFYPVFIEGWGGWWNNHYFQVYEKGLSGNYKTIDLKNGLNIWSELWYNFNF